MNRFVSLSLAAALALALSPAHAEDTFKVSPEQMTALGITLKPLDAADHPTGLSYPAQVVLPPQNEQVLSAPVAGMVDQILVGENQAVPAGEALLRLSSPEFGELQLQLLEAASAHRLAQQTLERERSLFKEGIIPQRRVLEAEAAATAASARNQQAREALRLAGLDAGSVDRIAGGGALQPGLTLRADAAATVVSLQVKPGQRVDRSDALLHMATLDRLWLDVQVPATRATNTTLPERITVPERGIEATPLSIGSVVSEGQTVTLRADVTKGTDKLRPGEFVQALVPAVLDGSTWTVPIAAVARQDDASYVFVRTTDGFNARPVTVVSSAGATVTVSGELAAGEQVAVSSVIALKAAWLGESGGE